MMEILHKVDDQVRCYDFPFPDFLEYYIEGIVMEIVDHGDDRMLHVLVTKDNVFNNSDSRVGDMVLVPVVSPFDKVWKIQRIMKLKDGKQPD